MDFKVRIKSLREENKLTHSQLGYDMDKTEGAVRAWETGRTKPDIETLAKLAEYFNCTTDYLLGSSDIKNTDELKKINVSVDGIGESINALLFKNAEIVNDLSDMIDILTGIVFTDKDDDVFVEQLIDAFVSLSAAFFLLGEQGNHEYIMVKMLGKDALNLIDDMFEKKIHEKYTQEEASYSIDAFRKMVEDVKASTKEGDSNGKYNASKK